MADRIRNILLFCASAALAQRLAWRKGLSSHRLASNNVGRRSSIMKIRLVHGIDRENLNLLWPGQRKKAITDGLKRCGYANPIQFVPESPVTYDGFFNFTNNASYLTQHVQIAAHSNRWNAQGARYSDSWREETS